MRIRIEYLKDTREALISTDETGKAWSSIVRACQDHSDVDFVEVNDTEIRLPWWSFLLAKEPIGYHVSRNGVKVEFSEEAKAFLQDAAKKQESYRKAEKAEAITEDKLKQILAAAGFKRKLTDEQTRNVLKLASLPAGATFSVPGAGKTTEALAYYCSRKSDNTKLFIVCPKNAFAVWEEQVAEIFPEKKLKVIRLTGGVGNIPLLLDGNPDVALITYHQVPYVENVIAGYLLTNEVFVFLDESHRMKRGNSGVIGSSILSMSHLPNAKCIMSGTPLPNGPGDLVPQFQFLYPEIPVEADTVKDLIKPIFVRTTKKELKIPDITRFETRIDLSPAQRTLYQLLCSEFAREN
ncbi:MAG TPA: SNF2-related protein [Ohtaekwangia sp.]|uniref:SNF2-related protein n=1 Tax=Ohtaekwangia sp. TaxID=2066019 RepID=UPI002F93A814